jgi:4-hydroxythreonine-4-phosphate dehydrogenase
VALTLGDPAGIGAELIARLLAKPETLTAANVVLVGDPWLWADGPAHRRPGDVATDRVASLAEVRGRADTGLAGLPADRHHAAGQVQRGRRSRLRRARCCGAGPVHGRRQCGEVDAICFAPLNKQAMKLGGLRTKTSCTTSPSTWA